MTGRRRPGRDRGAFTAELAAGLPALMVLLMAALTAVGAVTAKAQCVDAAREAALAGARGDPAGEAGQRVAPPGATVQVLVGTEVVTATVRAPVRLLGAHLPMITVRASAAAAREPAIPGGPEGGGSLAGGSGDDGRPEAGAGNAGSAGNDGSSG